MDEALNFLYSAAEGSTTEIEKLIKKDKLLVEAVDDRGRNALMYTCMTENVKNFQFLIKKGISVLNTDRGGATVLHWATQCGSAKICKLIISTSRTSFLSADGDGVTPLHIAATRSCAKILKMFIEQTTETDDVFTSAKDRRGRSPLHYAATRCSLDCVRTILDSPVLGLPVDQKDDLGLTPLMCAAGTSHQAAVAVCKELAIRKPVSKSTRNQAGLTALHIAVAAGNTEVVRLLLEQLGCQPELFDNDLRTPLHYAAEQDSLEMVQLLLQHGANNSTRDKHGITAAHFAAQNATNCLQAILNYSQITEVKDNEQRSCLMWAVVAGNKEAVDNLLQTASPGRQDKDIRGFTALHLAAMMGHEQICKVLVTQGWNNRDRDKMGVTALHLAAGRGHTDVVRCLVTSGALTEEHDSMQRTPIFWACLGGQAHTLYIMIKELGFQWRTAGSTTSERRPVTDILGRTPLHAAAFGGFSACIHMLLQIESMDDSLIAPLVGWGDHDGEMALHVACRKGKIDCVIVLLKAGAAVNAQTRKTPRETPLDIAEKNGHDQVAENLKDEGGLTGKQLRNEAARVLQIKFLPFIRRKTRNRKSTVIKPSVLYSDQQFNQ